jgi:peptide/nickel transport system ATP-binding protein
VSELLLHVADLQIRSRAGPIVDGLGFELRGGETIGIVGESGSGKSMTARALVGLLPPGVTASGTVQLGSVDLLGLRERDWRKIRGSEIALILQDPFTMLSPLMRVGRQITETLRRSGRRRPGAAVRRSEAVRRLREVGIRDEGVVDRFPFQLSGGMRQRVGLAGALASDPTILIADEPSTALDVTTQKEILRLIRSVQHARGMAVVLITHDLRVAFSMCDRIYVLYAGALLEVSPALELERAPLHPYTFGLLESEPPLDARLPRLNAIPGSVPPAGAVVSLCAFADRCSWARPKCREARPALVEVANGRYSACIRVNEIRSELEVVQRPPSTGFVSAEPVKTASLIEVVDLVKHFGHGADVTRALEHVTLTVGEGDSVGLVGESGSGKTTLARCIVGLEQPSSGAIEIAGIDATHRTRLPARQQARLRHTVQMVFQDPYSTLNPSRSVGFTLREALRYGPAPPAAFDRAVGELLNRVGLPKQFEDRKPVSLSGGERQRVAIARALALQPRVLICDEPVSALDVSVQAQILNLFSELRETLGLTYVFITHDLAVVRQVADTVHVMYRGRVVEKGPTDAVLDRASNEYTRSLIGSVPRSDPTWLDSQVTQTRTT